MRNGFQSPAGNPWSGMNVPAQPGGAMDWNTIYQQITGVAGAFSTRIAFVAVDGTPPQQRYKLVVSDYDGENQQIARKQAA